MRDCVNTNNNQLYEAAVKTACKVNVVLGKSKITARQVHRENIHANSPSEYLKRAVTIPFLDEIVSQIKSCILEEKLDMLDAMFVMPSFELFLLS